MAKIALLTELFAPSVGGQEIRFQSVAEHLARRGHEVHVYCIAHEDGLPEREVHPSGYVVNRCVANGAYKRTSALGMRRSVRSILAFALQLRRTLPAQRFDAVLANQWPLLHVVLLPRALRRMLTIDWCEIRNGGFYRAVQATLPRLAAGNFAVSTAVAAGITRQGGRDCRVVESGIDRAEYRAADPAERGGILYFGRLAPHKNVALLIEAFGLLRDGGSDQDLVIAGGGPSLAELKALAAASRHAPHIRFAGFVTDEEKLDLLARARVLVLPSRREGFPRVIAEAYASGLPVVTTDYPENGSTAVIREFGGGIVCDPTPRAVADAIGDACARREPLVAEGRTAAETLDWEHLIGRVEAGLLMPRRPGAGAGVPLRRPTGAAR